MGYSKDSKISPAIEQAERQLLMDGFSYAEIATRLGVRHKSVSERNRLVYGINIQERFAIRINKNGIPNRLSVRDSFGYWFSGFFDGEGHLGVYSRIRANGYPERRLNIKISLRYDDADTIQFIYDNLQIGRMFRNPQKGTINETVHIVIEPVKDLAEIVIPLFERYPLHTKKAKEFTIWRDLVRMQYIYTLGGYSQRAMGTEANNVAFDKALQLISKIRHV